MLLSVAVIVEKILKKAFEFGYVNNNGVFFQLLKNFGLPVADPYPRIEKLKKQIGEAADFVRQQAGVMIIGIAQKFIDPPVGRDAGTGRGCFLLFGHGCIRQIITSRNFYNLMKILGII